MFAKRIVGFLISAGLMFVLTMGSVRAEAPAGGAVKTIQVQFLNPLLNERSVYSGEVWHYPTYNGSEVGKKLVVEARARSLNDPGTPAEISPTWVTSDPQRCKSPRLRAIGEKITVSKPGKSSLLVTLGKAPGR